MLSQPFRTHAVSNRIARIVDPWGVAMYLVMGGDRCALIDAGCGYPGLRRFVEHLCDKPCLVLISHGHVDHAMGAVEFDDVRINHADDDTLLRHGNRDFRRAFLAAAAGQNRVAGDVEVLPAPDPRALGSLADNEVFDLGGMHIRAISAPGHTPGTMAFLLEEERLMMLGDACGPGTLLVEDASSDIASYLSALERIQRFDDAYDSVLRQHGSYESSHELLDSVIDACCCILQGGDDQAPMPKGFSSRLAGSQELPCFTAFAPAAGAQRAGGGEGNITYRIDKLPEHLQKRAWRRAAESGYEKKGAQ